MELQKFQFLHHQINDDEITQSNSLHPVNTLIGKRYGIKERKLFKKERKLFNHLPILMGMNVYINESINVYMKLEKYGKLSNEINGINGQWMCIVFIFISLFIKLTYWSRLFYEGLLGIALMVSQLQPNCIKRWNKLLCGILYCLGRVLLFTYLNDIPFLDCTLYIDTINNKIRTKSYSKPGNIHEYTKESSNIPRHTLKSIVIGMLKRYIIINDDLKQYKIPQSNLFQRLIQLGWSWDTINAIPNKPS
eukprot:167972_1